MKPLRPLLVAVVLSCFTAIPNLRADSAPPGGGPEGPFTGFGTPEPRKGEAIVRFTSAAFKKANSNLKNRYGGRTPSKNMLWRELAMLVGMRISQPVSGRSFVVKGTSIDSTRLRTGAVKGLVSRVEPNFKVNAFAEPSDFFYTLGLLWGLNNTGDNGSSKNVDVDAPEAWGMSTGSSDLVVAVVDTGVSLTHPDLIDNIWRNPGEIPKNNIDDDKNGFIDDYVGYDFVGNKPSPNDQMFHGTHCAGIIAARLNNGRGIAGVAPNVKIMPLRVLNARGEGDVAGVMKAIRYAIDARKRGINVRVINASLGGGDRVAGFEELLREANQAGIVFVAAAGNESNDNDAKPTYPANFESPNVISVAAIDKTGKLASFSNFGERSVDVAAPGVGIWSTFLFGFYLPFDGTSMAAPFVSGVAALILSERPNLSPAQVISIIKNSTKRISGLEGAMVSPGVVSAERALRSL
jgi:subtilisin family serine protease